MFSHYDLFTHDQLEDRRIDGVAKMVFVCLFLCLFLYYREQVDSILRCVCSVVDHRRQIKCQGHPTTVFSQMLLNAVSGYLEYF